MSGGLRLGIFNDNIFEAYVVVCMCTLHMKIALSIVSIKIWILNTTKNVSLCGINHRRLWVLTPQWFGWFFKQFPLSSSFVYKKRESLLCLLLVNAHDEINI